MKPIVLHQHPRGAVERRDPHDPDGWWRQKHWFLTVYACGCGCRFFTSAARTRHWARSGLVR